MGREEDNLRIHREKSKNDKIFNGRYKFGDGLIDPSDYNNVSNVKVSDDYASEYLNDIYDYENSVEYKALLSKIDKLIDTHEELVEIFKHKNDTGYVFNKKELNIIFKVIFDSLKDDMELREFSYPIYVVDIISNYISMSHDKIFKYLNYEFRELLLIELDKHFNIFNNNSKNGKFI